MLVSSNVTMQFGSKPLFENISVKFGGGNRYGLIGANGSGKSTFMKILGGDLEPTLGNVSLDPNERIGKLRQDQFAFEEFTVLDTVIMGHKELWEVKQERDRIYALPEMSEEDGYKVADLEVKYGEMDGYSAEARAGELLLGVGIPVEQHYGPMSEVAPGWKLRVLLAQALFADPDILLLDEPTNNLDIDTIRWLEQVLNERDSTMIIISHDRHFLNMVCTHMADLDYGELRVYPGNYDEYMTAATQARERLLADNAKKKAQIAELQSFVSRFSANASKSRQATSRARQIDKIKLEEVKASSRQNPFIRFEQDKKLFRNALEVEGLTKGFDNGPLFKNLNLLLEVGEKLAVLGTNGVGKSTLLKTLVGDLQPDSGTVKWSENARIGYYAQDHEYEFENDLTVFEWMSQWKQEGDDEQAVRSILGRLLFSQDDIKKPAKVLSGGEKGRMLFGKLMMQKPNILIMDEPTNHLDAESVAWLERFLHDFEGTVVAITHDRYFLDNVAGWILELDRGEGIPWEGNYSSWLEQKDQRLAQEASQEAARRKSIEKELEWVRQGTKGRQSKGKARLARFEELNSTEYQKRNETNELFIPPGPRLGDKVLEVSNLRKSYGDRLLIDDLSFSIPKGAIVGIIGPNGAGKSTLFRMISGQEQPDSGTITLGETVKLASVDQFRDSMDNSKTVWEEVSGGLDIMKIGNTEMPSRAYVGRFNFKGVDQGKRVGELSGGERGRLHLAKLLQVGGNMLLLDEPTNDLDIETLRALENALLEFPGCAMVISHDRWFLDRIATHILDYQDEGKVEFFEGNFTEYEEYKKRTLGADALEPKRIKYKRIAK